MSSFPLPDNSEITNAPESLRPREQSTLRFPSTARAEARESAGIEPALQAILEQALERTAATAAAIVLLTQGVACCRASTGAPAPQVGARLHGGRSLTGLCLESGEILVCNDTTTDHRVDPRLCDARGIRSLLLLPIKQNANVVGLLELISVRPNSFSQHDAADLSKLADQVLPLLSASETISDHLDQLPSKDIDAASESQTNIDAPAENTDLPATTKIAEAIEPNEPNIGSQLPHHTVTMRSPEHRSQAHWLRMGLAVALALGIIGYGFHLSRSRAANYIPPVAAESHDLAIQEDKALSVETVSAPQQDVLPEQHQWQSKSLDNVLTATRQETMLAIQDPIQSTDVNRTLNEANAGDPVAQYEMGLQYADGKDLPQSYADAMAWFKKAAENGNDKAQWKLGLGYMKGIGVPQDERTAVAWFKRAANQGESRAQSALSDAYLSGRGIPRDYVRAYTWAAISAGLRDNDNPRLRRIASRMTAGEIDDAHRRISIWWERHSHSADVPANSQ